MDGAPTRKHRMLVVHTLVECQREYTLSFMSAGIEFVWRLLSCPLCPAACPALPCLALPCLALPYQAGVAQGSVSVAD